MSAAPVSIEIVSDDRRLAEIGPAWMALWSRADALVFQSHAWVAAWWATAPNRSGRSLRIVLAWHGDELVGVMPLGIRRHKGIRVLEWAAKDHTDYADMLLAPEAAPELAGSMWKALSDAGGFDLAYLPRLLPAAQACGLSGGRGRSGVRLATDRRSEVSLRVAGGFPSGAAWFDAQSKKMRQNYRRGQKFLGEQGSLRFRLLSPDEPIGPVLERLAALKRQWLTGKTVQSDLFDEGTAALPALVQVLADLGLLRIFVLECGGTIVAIAVNFIQAGRMMAFLTTYDAAYERGSPGAVLMTDYIRWSFDNSLDLVDFLCGDEPFKHKFATDSVRLDALSGGRTWLGRAALLADRVGHAVKTRTRRGSPARGEGAEAVA
ncbi:GNAT family N-acetyltransferase [Methylobacterium sp. A54F]